MKKSETHNVTSFSQSGGITAHTVNLGSPPRHLDDDLRQQLDELLPKRAKVNVRAIWGDQEAFQFACEIKDHIAATKRSVTGVDQVMLDRPFFGQQLDPFDGETCSITIGAIPLEARGL